MNLTNILTVVFIFTLGEAEGKGARRLKKGAAGARRLKKGAGGDKLSACISAYPGTGATAYGKISVSFDDTDMTYKYNLKGLEESVVGGTHIHSGKTCYDADLVGGHYWASGDDPWNSDTVYSTDHKGKTKGEFEVNSGYDYDSNLGHAVVVHASDGARVGCGVLVHGKAKCGKKKKENKKRKLSACVSAYPGSQTDVTGKITAEFVGTDITYKFNLKGLEESVVGGTHIHSGKTCYDADLVGGHYWASGDDPWTSDLGSTVYSTDHKGKAKGEFDVNSGYDYYSNLGHAVVVHASDGARVGCGVLVHGKAKCGKN